MSLGDHWRAFVARHIAAPPTPMTRPGRVTMVAGDVLAHRPRRSRVTRTLVEQTVNGRYLGRAPGIRVRAQNIGACVAVIAANRGLTPRHEQEVA